MIFFDCETYRRQVTEGRWHNVLKLGWVSYVDSRYSTAARMEFTEPGQFWDVVDAHAAWKKRLWVFSHFSDYDLAVLNWWDEMQARGWAMGEKFIIGHPTCIDLRKGGATVRLVDTMNWFNTSVRKLGDTLGFPKGEFDFDKIEGLVPGTAEWEECSSYCRRDVEILERAVASWIGLVQSKDLGPFAFTAAGQAFTAYRRRFLPEAPVTVPGSGRVLALERAAYAGGLTAVWHRGEVGEVRIADVTSMYPYVMREHLYPRAVAGHYRAGKMSVGRLARVLEDGHCVVAQVYVDVPAGQELLPVKGERLEYPCGRFSTTLCTPEVETALRAGVVLEVGAVTVYHADHLFRRWVDEMFALRQAYLDGGNAVYADLVKIGLLNSLYGKFGQYNYEWDEIDGDEWGVDDDTEFVMVDGKARPIRRLGNYIELRSATRLEPALSFPAVAGHVTAYARTLLRSYRAACGPAEVFYADTDSLFLTPAGYEAGVAAGAIRDSKVLGYLYHDPDKDVYTGGTIYGLKVYDLQRAGGERTVKMKGVRRGAVKVGEGSYRVEQYRGMLGMLRDRDPGHALTVETTRRLACIQRPNDPDTYRKGVVLPSGKVVPHQRSEPRPTW